MNLTITLKDPKSCNGCPCLKEDFAERNFCGVTNDNLFEIIKGVVGKRFAKTKRPQRCVKEHGP